MKDIIEYKAIVLDKTGNYGLYSKNMCMSNSECVSDYSKSYLGYSTTLQNFVKQGNIVFLNDKGLVEAYMPKKISDEQLYMLDLMLIKMNGLKCMKIKKIGEEEYVLEDKIDERFSSEVIQSYFNKSKQKNK